MDDKGRPTTLEEIEALPKNVLCPADVAAYLDKNPYSINCASQAGTLPWAYQMGTRTVIPKDAFVNFHRYGRMTFIQSRLLGSREEIERLRRLEGGI